MIERSGWEIKVFGILLALAVVFSFSAGILELRNKIIVEQLQKEAVSGFYHFPDKGKVVCIKIEKPGRCQAWIDKERFDLIIERFVSLEEEDGE